MNIKAFSWVILLAIPPAHPTLLSPEEIENIDEKHRYCFHKQQLQRDELEKWEPRSSPSPTLSESDNIPFFTVSKISIKQAGYFPVDKQSLLLEPFIGKCLGMKSIPKLMQKISDGYIEERYITSRAFLAEQDLSGGELNITVMEGKLEDIQLDKRSDQDMKQINRPRQTPVQIEILPAAQSGYSLANLTATPELPLSAGIGQMNGSLTANNLSGLADQ